MNSKYLQIQVQKESLFKMRLKSCAENKSEPWTINDIELALKCLKNGTSRDPYGYANELFKSEVAGKDFKLATLKLTNKIKKNKKSQRLYSSVTSLVSTRIKVQEKTLVPTGESFE